MICCSLVAVNSYGNLLTIGTCKCSLPTNKEASIQKKYRPEAVVAVAMTVAVAEEDEELLSVLENKIFGAKRVLVTFLNIILVKSIYLVFRSQFRFTFTPQSLRSPVSVGASVPISGCRII